METNIFNPHLKPEGYFSVQRKEVLEFVPRSAQKILEVGCGSGVFGGNLKAARQAEVWGIELYPKVAEEAKQRLDRVFVGDIESDSFDLPKGYFDCVIFNDVLEHLRDPWLVLRKVCPLLVTEGYVVASIPNIRYFYVVKDLLFSKEWRYVDLGVLDKTHLRFFTQKTIQEMFESCEYEIKTIQGINPIVFPWKFRTLNWVLNKRFEDMRYLQFVCVAQKTVA